MLATKGMCFPIDVILVCIRWYAAYPLSYRHLEEMMQERGVFVDHSSINRWAIRFLPLLERVLRKHKQCQVTQLHVQMKNIGNVRAQRAKYFSRQQVFFFLICAPCSCLIRINTHVRRGTTFTLRFGLCWLVLPDRNLNGG